MHPVSVVVHAPFAAPSSPRSAQRRSSVWCPESAGPYRLPSDIQAYLASALGALRNRDAAYALAVFLARYWSAPRKLALGFPIDRRALAAHPELGLSEHQVRAARDTLERIGFLVREEQAPGHRYQRTAEGPHRRPILFRFGPEHAPAFAKANARAQAARGAHSGKRRPITPAPAHMVSQARPGDCRKSPSHKHPQAVAVVIMGDQAGPQSETALDAAVERWKIAFENRLAISRELRSIRR